MLRVRRIKESTPPLPLLWVFDSSWLPGPEQGEVPTICL